MRMKKESERKQRAGFVWWGVCVLFLLSMNLSACAPSLYSINMKYEPTAAFRPADGEKGKFLVTVTTFEDMRKTNDKMMIGQVTKVDGGRIPVFPKYVKPKEAVTAGMKQYLGKAGFTVSGDKPAWDLKADSLRKEWGDVVIGGIIEDLDVSCEDLLPSKKYRAKAKLTVFFADVKKKWVFYKTTAQSSSSLDHVLFSEQRLEDQMNGVLSDAIEKLFEGGEAERKIMAAAQGKSE